MERYKKIRKKCEKCEKMKKYAKTEEKCKKRKLKCVTSFLKKINNNVLPGEHAR